MASHTTDTSKSHVGCSTSMKLFHCQLLATQGNCFDMNIITSLGLEFVEVGRKKLIHS